MLGKPRNYRTPNGKLGAPVIDVKSVFKDSKIALPKWSHLWRFVKENDSFASWVLNTAEVSSTPAIEPSKVLGHFLDGKEWSLDDLMRLGTEDTLGLERKLEIFTRLMEFPRAKGQKRSCRGGLCLLT